jgi:hypothetical protein
MLYNYYPLYLLLIAFAGLLSFTKGVNRVLPFFVITLSSFFIGLRGASAGSDTVKYIDAYNAIDVSSFDYQSLVTAYVANGITAAEPGFLFVSYVFKLVGLGELGYLVSIAFLSLFIIYKALQRFETNTTLVLVLFACSITLVSLQGNVIRQALASAFFLYGLSFLYQNRKSKFVFWGLVGGLFHLSAVAVTIVCFAVAFSYRQRYYWLGFIVVAVVTVTGLIGKVASLAFGGLIAMKLTKYFVVGIAGLMTFKLLSFFIIYGVFFGLRFVDIERYRQTKINFYLAVYFCLFYLQFLFSGDLVSSERFGLYRFLWEPLMFSLLPGFFKQSKLVVSLIVFVCLIYGILVYNLPTVQYMLTPM